MMKTLSPMIAKAENFLDKTSWLPPLLARISVGGLFVQAGWGKVHNIQKVIGYFQSLGIPAAEVQARLVATTELTCGSLLIIGLLTRIVSIPLSVIMLIALLTAKKAEIEAFTDLFGISEFLVILLLIWLIFEGAGKISVDAVLKKKLNRS